MGDVRAPRGGGTHIDGRSVLHGRHVGGTCPPEGSNRDGVSRKPSDGAQFEMPRRQTEGRIPY